MSVKDYMIFTFYMRNGDIKQNKIRTEKYVDYINKRINNKEYDHLFITKRHSDHHTLVVNENEKHGVIGQGEIIYKVDIERITWYRVLEDISYTEINNEN